MDESVDNSEIDAFLSEEIGLLQGDLEDGWKEVLVNYGYAMMAAQLLERSVALLVVADDPDELDTLAREEVERRFRSAFTSKTLGKLRKESPVAGDEQRSKLLGRAWKKRNELAHRFLLDNTIAILDAEQHDRLVSDLGDAFDLFESARQTLAELFSEVLSARGVTSEEVERFGRMGQLVAMQHPEALAGLDLWKTEDGEKYVQEVARTFGLDMDAPGES